MRCEQLEVEGREASGGCSRAVCDACCPEIECREDLPCAGVPRVFDRIYTGAMAKIEEKGGLAARLFKLGYGIKAAKLRRNIRYDKVCFSAEL